MLILAIDFCSNLSVLRIIYLLKTLLNILRFVVPAILIVMIIMDVVKNVINPDEKEGVKKIKNRIIAAIIVFFIPTIINLVVNLINYIFDDKYDMDYKDTLCYTNATSDCLEKINDYINCSEYELDENDNTIRQKCLTYRTCNFYRVNSNCSITTIENSSCKQYNEDSSYNQFKK